MQLNKKKKTKLNLINAFRLATHHVTVHTVLVFCLHRPTKHCTRLSMQKCSVPVPALDFGRPPPKDSLPKPLNTKFYSHHRQPCILVSPTIRPTHNLCHHHRHLTPPPPTIANHHKCYYVYNRFSVDSFLATPKMHFTSSIRPRPKSSCGIINSMTSIPCALLTAAVRWSFSPTLDNSLRLHAVRWTIVLSTCYSSVR